MMQIFLQSNAKSDSVCFGLELERYFIYFFVVMLIQTQLISLISVLMNLIHFYLFVRNILWGWNSSTKRLCKQKSCIWGYKEQKVTQSYKSPNIQREGGNIFFSFSLWGWVNQKLKQTAFVPKDKMFDPLRAELWIQRTSPLYSVSYTSKLPLIIPIELMKTLCWLVLQLSLFAAILWVQMERNTKHAVSAGFWLYFEGSSRLQAKHWNC